MHTHFLMFISHLPYRGWPISICRWQGQGCYGARAANCVTRAVE